MTGVLTKEVTGETTEDGTGTAGRQGLAVEESASREEKGLQGRDVTGGTEGAAREGTTEKDSKESDADKERTTEG